MASELSAVGTITGVQPSVMRARSAPYQGVSAALMRIIAHHVGAGRRGLPEELGPVSRDEEE